MGTAKAVKGILTTLVLLYALLSYPSADPPVPAGASGKPFTWKQDEKWMALEKSFQEARQIGCGATTASLRIRCGVP